MAIEIDIAIANVILFDSIFIFVQHVKKALLFDNLTEKFMLFMRPSFYSYIKMIYCQ